MAKAQYPLDGAPGKGWKITSEMGWRIHPVKKTRKHHNGADIIGTGKGPHYIEAPYAGKVLKARNSPGGFGNYVILQHKINGKFYTTLYAHLKDGSTKVKPGQKVEAGTVLGIMGTTGMSTGVHLHWEMWAGKTHGWSADGSGFVNAVKFFKALIAQEAELAATPKASSQDVVSAVPKHSVVDKEDLDKPVAKKPAPPKPPVAKPAAKPAAKPVAKPAAKPAATAKPKLYTVKSGDSYWAIGERLGVPHTKLQKLNKNKPLKPGDKIIVG